MSWVTSQEFTYIAAQRGLVENLGSAALRSWAFASVQNESSSNPAGPRKRGRGWDR